ncbi:MAG: hypothetical protein LBR38_03410, partial [Synergistaceae bacterium]|nr:hypothetical protein [Synergistaceae bacterium]
AEIVARNDGNAALVSELKALCRALDAAKRPLVLFIDEIDALVGDTLVSVLRQLRTGYTNRPESFPISVILCGVRDVRDYRISTSGGDVITGGSCFNIKAESLRLGDFSDDEIRELYLQHTEATGQVFEEDVYPRVWELTRGQPWLVNALAHEATWRMKDARDRAVPITLARIDQAAENLILERATHLDQLIDKLSEPRVRRVIEPLLSGDDALLSLPDDDVRYAIDLGLIRRKDGIGSIEIANAIYKEVIPRQLTWTTQATITQDTAWYVAPDGRLDMTKLICAFQQFFRENAESWIERFDYKEAGFQLLLQAFLQRIVNGGGLIEREYALGRRRVDLLVRWPYPKDAGMRDRLEQRVVLELKTIRKKHSPEYVLHEGLEQTAAYADAAGADEAHLLICDERPGISRSWDEKIYDRVERAQGGKQIHVWGM